MSEATQGAVLQLLDHLADFELWIDGGWGVDALLGTQTRTHADLDIIVRDSLYELLLQRLVQLSYSRQQGAPVFESPSGLVVDVHQVVFDATGYGSFDLGDGREWPLPPSAFLGRGTIGSRPVCCLSAEAQVQCHAQGYEPKPKDFADMQALQRRFHLVLPLLFGVRKQRR